MNPGKLRLEIAYSKLQIQIATSFCDFNIVLALLCASKSADKVFNDAKVQSYRIYINFRYVLRLPL